MDKEPFYDDGYQAYIQSDLDDPERLIRAGDDSPDSPKKRRQGWMNKNMPFMMGALALMLVVGSLLFTGVLGGGPDYIVGLVTSYTMPEPGRKQLENLLAAYADDRNGDGKVVVQVKAFAFVPNTTDLAQREEADLDLETALITGECMVFLHDRAALDEIAGQVDGLFQYNNGELMPKGAGDYENAYTVWEGCKALAGFEPDPDRLNMWDPQIYLELCQNLRLSVRGQDEAVLRDDEMLAYQKASAAFAQRLRDGEKPGA